MNWSEFFFGWLIKGQYKVTMLDGIIFFVEFMIVVILFFTIQDLIEKFKKKKRDDK